MLKVNRTYQISLCIIVFTKQMENVILEDTPAPLLVRIIAAKHAFVLKIDVPQFIYKLRIFIIS